MCIKYTDTYSCGHVYSTNTIKCFDARCHIVEYRPGTKARSSCARLICRRSEWSTSTRFDNYEYERRSHRRVVRERDCGRDFGFREYSRRRLLSGLDVDRERRWVEVGDGYVATRRSRRIVRIGPSVDGMFVAIINY